MTGPLVSVLLPCYQAEEHLEEALASILGQSHRELEVLAVDDGSTDGTRRILEGAREADPRVRVLVNPENKGLIATLNLAIAEARGDFIARMDADDVSHPDRFRRQLAWLQDRPEIAALGSGVEYMDEEGSPLGADPPRARSPDEVRFLILLATPMSHGSLLARAEVLRRVRYRHSPECLHAEDYDLFVRLVEEGLEVAVLPEPLYRHRVRRSSVSFRFEEHQIESFTTLARGHLERTLGLTPPPEIHRVALNRGAPRATVAELRAGLALVREVTARFLEREGVSPALRDSVEAVAAQQRLDILLQAVLKASPGTRVAAAALLLRETPALRYVAVRDFLGAKLARSVAPTGDGWGGAASLTGPTRDG